ncbi:MAG: metallophosphoesterase family protein [Muribaculaceae bacterium]|jgi:putative phosphoesterase|nr:metallophosphoesterase family protein [Muribaculaceae bacterium]
MKRIGILSDTHSCWDDRYATHFADCDEIWHAGDVGDIDIIRRLEAIAPVVRAVRGNIDHGDVCRRCPEVEIFTIEGFNVWLTHIGGYPGKYAPGIMNALIENRINLMVCGHSHILKVMPDPRLGLLHINPGAAGYHGWQRERTLIRLELEGGEAKSLEVIELGKRKL